MEPFCSDEEVKISDPFHGDSIPASSSSSCTSNHVSDHESSVSRESSTSEDLMDFEVEDIGIDEPFVEFGLDSINVQNMDDVCSEPLFKNSSLSVLQTLSMLFMWFSSFPGISKEAFSNLLSLLSKHILPSDNSLPSSYTKGLILVKDFIIPSENYDCCINDCIIYRREYKDLDQCPKCMKSRYLRRKKVAQNTFKYLPLSSRIKRMFSNKKVSQLIQSHSDATSDSDVVSNLHQSPGWKELYEKTGDARALSLSLCTDGMNPFSKEKTKYSMWPIQIACLNLPHHIRYQPGSMMLIGIIPGPEEPKAVDTYLSVLVEEIDNNPS